MTAIGIVFDIQRFALHDGPGIRTTVFLKGCPLRCWWCHNPESQRHEPQCSYYGETGGYKIIGKSMTVEDVTEEVARDIDYYATSGGGMTLSGGEPMLQLEFSTALAAEAKRRNIRVCLDTSGFAPTSHFEKIAPFIDLYLFDFKESDPKKHTEVTGVSNDLILTNLDYLYSCGASIILRCPLIPGVNDSVEHLEGIAALVKKYPRIAGVQVMVYHDMGVHKAARIGVHAPLAHLKTVDEKTKAKWMYKLRTLLQQHDLASMLLEIG